MYYARVKEKEAVAIMRVARSCGFVVVVPQLLGTERLSDKWGYQL
jgi:hypothetical protein